uniref:Uncharacterized protein n=1 Tax=viral metagenome TaxID=1070528 RepID=A0A6M3J6D8_9ZZZZ
MSWGGRCTQGQRPLYFNFRGVPRHLVNERTVPRTIEDKIQEADRNRDSATPVDGVDDEFERTGV